MSDMTDQAVAEFAQVIEEQELQADAYHNCCKIIQTD